MAYYYTTDAFSTWNVADPAFPDELPEYGERIYLAIVDGPVGQKSSKAMSPVYEGQYMGTEWLQDWYKQLHRDPAYGPNATIIWVKIPPKPQVPEEWKVCGPTVCDNRSCPGYDDGYCMSDDGDTCPHAKIHKEFSIIRPANPTTLGEVAVKNAHGKPGVTTYNLPWRNAFVYWVDWNNSQMGLRIGADDYYCWNFAGVNYSATDDIQAIKMILDRLVMNQYRYELAATGSPIRPILEYVADILANPYEWNTKI